jgi:hypothetical protein
MTTLRDIALVARFEVLRAIRTWRAHALLLLYGIAYGGASYLFVMILHAMENSVASSLGVAKTDRPGALLDQLVESDLFGDMIAGMTGGDALLDLLTTIPPLAIFGMWLGLLLIPFFAASSAAECISIDLGSRALRFEALRTGRFELLLGRFSGQLVLSALATVIALLVVWAVGMLFMVGHTAVGLASWLLWLSSRAWLFSIPFVGIGVAASAATASPAWARVMAIGATAGTWVLYGLAAWLEGGSWSVLSDLAYQLLPQGWMQGLWEPVVGWVPSALVLTVLGLAAAGVGQARFAMRDL